jgi:hypothetical protein
MVPRDRSSTSERHLLDTLHVLGERHRSNQAVKRLACSVRALVAWLWVISGRLRVSGRRPCTCVRVNPYRRLTRASKRPWNIASAKNLSSQAECAETGLAKRSRWVRAISHMHSA